MEKFRLQGSIADVDVTLIDKADWNPNEMAPKEFERLRKELMEIGMLEPIQVVSTGARFKIIGGHHRYDAARDLGWPTVPCLVLANPVFQDEKFQKFANVRLNVIKGKLSPTKFAELYSEMAKEYNDEYLAEAMGFVDQDAMQAIVGDLKKDIGRSDLPDEMKKSFSKKAKKASSVEDINEILDTLFSEYGNHLDCGFMVFVTGERQHIYVPVNSDTVQTALTSLTEGVLHRSIKIEEVVSRIFTKEAVEHALSCIDKEKGVLDGTSVPEGQPTQA